MQTKVLTQAKFSSLKFKFLLVTFFSFFLSLLFTPSTFAQTSTPALSASIPPSPTLQTTYISPQSPNSGTLALYNFFHGALCLLVGQSPMSPCLEYKTFTDSQGLIRSVPILSNTDTSMGVLGVGKSLLTGLYINRPLSSSEFIADMGRQVGLVKEAHAQVGGSGNSILSPVYKLWEVSRNIAYLTMIVIFLIVGFMVMFRQRLNPQTVVSVQLALPGLVIGLVLITFSYFMASLITDIAFLGTDLVGYYFQAAQSDVNGVSLPNPKPSLLDTIASENSASIMSRMTSAISDFDIGSGINSVMSNLSGRASLYVNGILAYLAYQYAGQATGGVGTVIGAIIGIAGGVPGIAAGSSIGAIVGNLAGGAGGSIVSTTQTGTALNYVISFVVVVMMILTIFKLIFKLINNFLAIIFYTILSPFTFLMASLPGKQGIVSDWIKNMLCNVLAFPGVLAVLYFSYFLLTGGQPVQPGDQAFRIAEIQAFSVAGKSALPLMGGYDLRIINILLAFGAFIATPSVPDIICKAIGKIGPAFGIIEQQIQGSQRGAQGYINQASGAPGKISKDVGSLGQLGTQKTWTYDPFGGTMVHAKGPGLWGQLTGRMP